MAANQLLEGGDIAPLRLLDQLAVGQLVTLRRAGTPSL